MDLQKHFYNRSDIFELPVKCLLLKNCNMRQLFANGMKSSIKQSLVQSKRMASWTALSSAEGAAHSVGKCIIIRLMKHVALNPSSESRS